MESVSDQVIKELTELKKLGIRVTAKQLAYPSDHPAEMEEYRVSMTISEIADLVLDLAQLR
jgi:hypothetical protein